MDAVKNIVQKSDYVLAKGPDGKRVWIHKVTGEVRTSLPTSDRPTPARTHAPLPATESVPPPPAPPEVVKDQHGKLRAERSDYVLAKGPDGKRVWIHKLTGEVRSNLNSISTSQAANVSAPIMAPPPPPPTASSSCTAPVPCLNAPSTVSEPPEDTKSIVPLGSFPVLGMPASSVDTAFDGFAPAAGFESDGLSGDFKRMVQDSLADLTNKLFGGQTLEGSATIVGSGQELASSDITMAGAKPSVPQSRLNGGSLEPHGFSAQSTGALLAGTLPAATLAGDAVAELEFPDAAILGVASVDEKEGGLLAGLEFGLVPTKCLIPEDYDLMAGNLSADDYNAAMRSIAGQKVQNAAAAEAASAATVASMVAQTGGANASFGSTATLVTNGSLGSPIAAPLATGGLVAGSLAPLAGVLPKVAGSLAPLAGVLPLPPLPALPGMELPALPNMELPALPGMELPTLPGMELPTWPKIELPPLPSMHLPTLPNIDSGALIAGIAGNVESIQSMDAEALIKAQAQAQGTRKSVQKDENGEEQEGLDVAMAAQLMQLNRFYLQQRVFDTQKMVASGEMPTRFKEGFRPMQLCKQFMKSASCVRGDTCSYAHTFEELHPMSPELPGAQSAKAVEALAEDVQPALADIPEPSMRMQRKRAMCQRLTRGGCLLGKKCPFAHSDAELGTVALAITDRVKTQLCKFFEQNKCVYGKYCVNAHGANEIGKPKPDYLCPPAKQNKEK